jgi:hypothetical protein
MTSPKQNPLVGNCGAYAAMNTMCYVMGWSPEHVYKEDDVFNIRRYMAMVSITGTLYEPNSDICPICGGWYTKSTYDNFVECDKCLKWTHLKCTRKPATDWEHNKKYVCLDCAKIP